MSFSQPFAPGQDGKSNSASSADSGSQPISNYGTLGPNSDFQASTEGDPGPVSRPPMPRLRFQMLAAAMGALFAVIAASLGSAHSAWPRLADLFAARGNAASPAPSSVQDLRQLDHLKPQKQAEALLQLAVGRSDAAVDQISTRVDRWQGKVKWTPQIATLTTAALNSSDMRVRESGIEVELAAYGLAKNSASFDYLARTAESRDHAQKIWALWALGLMGNRGVETGRAVQILTNHMKDADQESRHWSVEGLALVGTPQTIPLLLAAMHDDPSLEVREGAACGLAESGMFTREQRLSAVPQLVNYTDDPSLDAQTHAWAFQALSDITHQRLPNDAEAWRSWYERQN
jgi:hypothetical protein